MYVGLKMLSTSAIYWEIKLAKSIFNSFYSPDCSGYLYNTEGGVPLSPLVGLYFMSSWHRRSNEYCT